MKSFRFPFTERWNLFFTRSAQCCPDEAFRLTMRTSLGIFLFSFQRAGPSSPAAPAAGTLSYQLFCTKSTVAFWQLAAAAVEAAVFCGT